MHNKRSISVRSLSCDMELSATQGHPGQLQTFLSGKKTLLMSSWNVLACHLYPIGPGLLAVALGTACDSTATGAAVGSTHLLGLLAPAWEPLTSL